MIHRARLDRNIWPPASHWLPIAAATETVRTKTFDLQFRETHLATLDPHRGPIGGRTVTRRGRITRHGFIAQ